MRPCYLALIVLGILGAASCRTRDPLAAGLLDADPPGGPAGESDRQTPTEEMQPATIAPNGDWRVQCRPADSAAGGERTYLLSIKGAVRPDDELQPLLVSLSLDRAGSVLPLGENQKGRGAIDPQGAIFVGFESGVLTADKISQSTTPAYQGVITLANDQDADALAVFCRAEPVTGSGP